MNLIFKKSSSNNKYFKELVVRLDQDLALRDGDEHDFYHQYNGIDQLDYVIVVYLDDIAIGCGAIKPYSIDTAEVKRMYVRDNFRGKRIATMLLKELEYWAVDLHFVKLILETGTRNPEAMAVYRRCGYIRRENYDQYANIETSVCFEKVLV